MEHYKIIKIMSKARREKVNFKATKIVSKPTKVSFHTKDGREVSFKAHKDIPMSVKVEFFAKRKKK